MDKKQLKLVSREFVGFHQSFSVQAEAFSKKHPDWEVKRDFFPVEVHHEKMVLNKGCLSNQYDLFLCNTDWLPEVMAEGSLRRLNDYIEQDPPEGWPHAWSDSMKGLQTDKDGNIYGIAYHDGPEMFIYRYDLFGDPKEQEAFQAKYGYPLEVPKTWNQFRDVALFFTRPEQGLYGAVAAGFPDGHNNVYDFLIHLWSRGGEVVNEAWEPVFDSEIGIEALQFYVDLYNKDKVFPPEAKKLDSTLTGEYYASGKAAMMWNWCGFAGMAEVPELSKVVGKTSTGLIPRGDGPNGQHISLNIYWVLGITAGAENPDMAYQFIKHCASAEMDKQTSVCGGNGTRLSTWRDPELAKQFPYYSMIEEVHKNVRSPLAIPEFSEINEVMNQMVDDAIHERVPVEKVLKDASAKIRTILAEAGYYN